MYAMVIKIVLYVCSESTMPLVRWFSCNGSTGVLVLPPSLADLMNDVASVIPAQWRAVGIQLGLSADTLDSIQRENAGKPRVCLESFEQVLTIWKRSGPKPNTWNTIVDVLRTPAVGQSALAEELCAMYY